jgi:endonuclease YncB( thermonuclease family)
MKISILLCVAAWLVVGCGGGGDNNTSGGSAETTNTSTGTPTECGIAVGSRMLTGVVTSVHDGDTITINSAQAGSVSVRLDSIDAPELGQLYGTESRNALVTAVLGKSVKVAYSKTDLYNRTVGAVFAEGCHYVNLDLVATGKAWYYKAYQCEISATARAMFSSAQAIASQSRIGLWAQASPEAPWYYRNGKEPTLPTCTSDSAIWIADAALSSTVTTVPVNTTAPVSSTGGSKPICYVGPRGGTYTITASGIKNYGGC